jgi:hypothetical protein
MRRSAKFCLPNNGNGFLDRPAVDASFEEMLFIGGSLSAKLLGASDLMPEA